MTRCEVVALAALALCACRTAPDGIRHATRLETAAAALELGELPTVGLQLEPVFTDGVPDERGADRFWAAWMLAQAHALLALEEVGPAGADRIARASHELAALYFARAAPPCLGAAQSASPPPGLEGLAAADAALGLELLRVALLSRLGFAERAGRSIEELAGSGEPEATARLLERGRLPPGLWARVWLTLFEDRADGDPRGAFPLAVRALAAVDAVPGSLEPPEVRAIEDWIEGGAGYVFRCPECRQPAVPALRVCPNDQTPLAGFFADPRP